MLKIPFHLPRKLQVSIGEYNCCNCSFIIPSCVISCALSSFLPYLVVLYMFFVLSFSTFFASSCSFCLPQILLPFILFLLFFFLFLLTLHIPLSFPSFPPFPPLLSPLYSIPFLLRLFILIFLLSLLLLFLFPPSPPLPLTFPPPFPPFSFSSSIP